MLIYRIIQITLIKSHDTLVDYHLYRYIAKRSGSGLHETFRYHWSRDPVFKLNEGIGWNTFDTMAYTAEEADKEILHLEMNSRKDGKNVN